MLLFSLGPVWPDVHTLSWQPAWPLSDAMPRALPSVQIHQPVGLPALLPTWTGISSQTLLEVHWHQDMHSTSGNSRLSRLPGRQGTMG